MDDDDDDDDEEPGKLSESDQAAISDLLRQRSAKVDEIVGELAKVLGFGNVATLSAEQRAELEDEAEDACER
jgi:hypothetical protein